MNRLVFYLLVFIAASANSLFAHPGHDLLKHGGAHVLSSSYHLAILSVVTCLCFFLGTLALKPAVRRLLHAFGAAGLFLIIWAARY